MGGGTLGGITGFVVGVAIFLVFVFLFGLGRLAWRRFVQIVFLNLRLFWGACSLWRLLR
ncbi:MAG: hypothetical protein ACI9Y1_002986 [Lentisphaeria bacterium]|jgi:hypothetical protein